MVIEKYNVTLEKEVVEESKKKLKVGQALSPVINDLLKKWLKNKDE